MMRQAANAHLPDVIAPSVSALPLSMTTRRVRIGGDDYDLSEVVDFDRAVDDAFAVLESRGAGEQLVELCPFFAKLWPAARGLAMRLAALGPPALGGRSVLEIGCGLALPSMVAARAGAAVTAVDLHPDAALVLAGNLARNAIATRGAGGVAYSCVDWRTPDDALGRFDFVVGSDVLYDRDHAPSLAAYLEARLAPGGLALIADPGRPYLQDFVGAMERLGFRAEVEAVAEVFVIAFRRVGGSA